MKSQFNKIVISCIAVGGLFSTFLGLIVTALSIYDYIIIERLHAVPVAVGERDVESVNKACEIYLDKYSHTYESFDENK